MSSIQNQIDTLIKGAEPSGYNIGSIKISKSDFLELYGNGLIKNQQVKDGQYSGIYKGIKIEAKA